jgi:hypothetical protein
VNQSKKPWQIWQFFGISVNDSEDMQLQHTLGFRSNVRISTDTEGQHHDTTHHDVFHVYGPLDVSLAENRTEISK